MFGAEGGGFGGGSDDAAFSFLDEPSAGAAASAPTGLPAGAGVRTSLPGADGELADAMALLAVCAFDRADAIAAAAAGSRGRWSAPGSGAPAPT